MRMYRRAYTVLIGTAVLMGVTAIILATWKNKSLADPDGFLGPAWVRLPMLVGGAFLADLLPRTLWQSKFRISAMRPVLSARIHSHWTRDRMTLVVLGVVCFYVTYVSYRNIKSFLPFIIQTKYDRELHLIDRVLMFGNDPSDILHAVLGTGFVAYVLSYIYLWFLPLVPLALTAWLVWSRNLSFGYWFATSQCIAWSLGTLSYYALPTLGPGFEYVAKYKDLPDTPAGQLMNGLSAGRDLVVNGGVEGVVQSVAGFASLHTAITLLVALMVQFTLRSKLLKIVFWVNFAITIVATLYFGWHYIADDVAGILIAFVAFYLGGIASGQRFERRSLQSHPTTTTSVIPVDRERV